MNNEAGLDDLLRRFRPELARLQDCQVIFERGRDIEVDRRKKVIEDDDSWVTYDEDGPHVDQCEFHEVQQGRVIEMYEEVGTSERHVEQLLRVSLHHAVEYFARAVAIEAASDLGLARPKGADGFNSPKWYGSAGIDLRSLPGFDVLNKLRGQMGRWKHTRFSEEADIDWFLRPTFTAAAYLDLDRRDELAPLEDIAAAAGEFAEELVAVVKARVAALAVPAE